MEKNGQYKSIITLISVLRDVAVKKSEYFGYKPRIIIVPDHSTFRMTFHFFIKLFIKLYILNVLYILIHNILIIYLNS